jgi:hypothetical protein
LSDAKNAETEKTPAVDCQNGFSNLKINHSNGLHLKMAGGFLTKNFITKKFFLTKISFFNKMCFLLKNIFPLKISCVQLNGVYCNLTRVSYRVAKQNPKLLWYSSKRTEKFLLQISLHWGINFFVHYNFCFSLQF